MIINQALKWLAKLRNGHRKLSLPLFWRGSVLDSLEFQKQRSMYNVQARNIRVNRGNNSDTKKQNNCTGGGPNINYGKGATLIPDTVKLLHHRVNKK